MSKCIILTGGGTAGHVTPNLALIPPLLARGFDVHYIGGQGMEKEIIEAVEGVTYHVIRSGKLRRYFSLKNFTDPFRVMSGVVQSGRVIARVRPCVVFSKGGFVGVPVVWAARMRRIPVVVHESDRSLGLANRLAARFADAVCASFPDALASVPAGRGVLTGTPMREELFKGDRESGRRMCGFTGDKPAILVVGGSSGAEAVNGYVRELLPRLLKRYDIIHVCGKGRLDASLEGQAGYRQFEYLDALKEYPHMLALCAVALSRAGANAVAEFSALRIPALYIPLPSSSSRGDQLHNAQYAREAGFGAVITQDQIDADSLYLAIDSLYRERAKYIRAMQAADLSHGTQKVLDVILGHCREEV